MCEKGHIFTIPLPVIAKTGNHRKKPLKNCLPIAGLKRENEKNLYVILKNNLQNILPTGKKQGTFKK